LAFVDKFKTFNLNSTEKKVTVSVGVANKVLVAQFDTKRISIPNTSCGGTASTVS